MEKKAGLCHVTTHIKHDRNMYHFMLCSNVYEVVLQITLYGNIFGHLDHACVLPHDNDADRKFAWGQHKETYRRVKVTQSGDKNSELVPERGATSIPCMCFRSEKSCQSQQAETQLTSCPTCTWVTSNNMEIICEWESQKRSRMLKTKPSNLMH